MAVISINTKLINDFKLVFAPIFNIYKCKLQWCAIFTDKGIPFSEYFSCAKHIRCNNLIT